LSRASQFTRIYEDHHRRVLVMLGPIIEGIASELDVAPAQVTLRWQIQPGIATIPKSVKKHRIHENGAVFGFSLNDGQMETIAALDAGDRIGPHPDHRDF